MTKLLKEDYEYRRTDNSVSLINYHFVFVPKRRKLVLIKDVAHRLQEIIFELVTEHGWKLIASDSNCKVPTVLNTAPKHEIQHRKLPQTP